MKNFFGFFSAKDFLTSLTGAKTYLFNSYAAIFAALTSFITSYIWDSPQAVYTLWILMCGDWITGIYKSFKNKSFVSYKVYRMPLYFFATSFVLSMSWNLAKHNWVFVPLPGMVYGGFCSVYFFSLLENLGELGYLPKSLVSLLQQRFGLKVLFDKFDKKEQKPE